MHLLLLLRVFKKKREKKLVAIYCLVLTMSYLALKSLKIEPIESEEGFVSIKKLYDEKCARLSLFFVFVFSHFIGKFCSENYQINNDVKKSWEGSFSLKYLQRCKRKMGLLLASCNFICFIQTTLRLIQPKM